MARTDYFLEACEARDALHRRRFERERQTEAYQLIVSLNSGDTKLVGDRTPSQESTYRMDQMIREYRAKKKAEAARKKREEEKALGLKEGLKRLQMKFSKR
jgi:hypothetical protein